MSTQSPADKPRQPKGIPVGGQYAASEKTEAGVPIEIVSAEDFTSRWRPEIDALERKWRDEADTERVFNPQIADLAKRVLDDAEKDRPGYDKLADAVEELDALLEDPEQDADDTAEEVIYCLQDVTDREKMKVVEDGHGGYLRSDGKPAYTCADCGNGYATGETLITHKEQDCDGAIDAEDAAEDDDASAALHSAAESFASDINNTGRATQVAFLRRMGVSDDDMLNAVASEDSLDDLVIDVCSETASAAYNDGESDADFVTRDLEGKRWMVSGNRTLTTKHPMALKAGECTDVTYSYEGASATYRVSYAEWVPNGDDNTPARGYLRGEFSSESEWGQHEYVVARESSPFREGERGLQIDYAWEKYEESLRVGVVKSIRNQRNDPLRAFIDGSDG